MSTSQETTEQQESVAFTDSYDIATNRFKSMIDEHVSSLTITPEEIQETERLTKGQSRNKFWFQKRKTVLTASNFGNVAKTKVEPSKKLKAILYSNFTTEAVQYGIESEQKATDLFTREMSKDGITVTVEEPGLSLSKDKPYLGASLDRIVTITDTNEKWGMEIKSPFSKAGMTVDEACKSKNFFLEKLSDGSVRLKRNHDYFCQVQGQLYCSIMPLKGIFLLCTLERTCHCLLKRSTLKVTDGMMTYYQRLTIFIVGLFSLRCLPNEFSEERYSIFMVVGYHMDNIHVEEMV